MANDVTARPAGSAERAFPRGWAGALITWAQRAPHAPLWLALAVSLIARVGLVIRTGAVIDGDEALVGIQAQRILQGQFPVYFYGQSYMGSLETYLTAAVIAVTGPTPWALRVVPIALSLALVYLTWRLARALLPRGAKETPLLAGLAALVAAVPPVYDVVTEMRAWGGQIEIYVITLALLLATVELADRLRVGAGNLELGRRWAIVGALAGLGFWLNPLVSYALLACGLWLAVALARRMMASGWRATARAALPALAAIGGAAIGGAPAWVFALTRGGANLAVYVTQPAVTVTDTPLAAQGRLALGLHITGAYLTCVAPRVLNGAMPGEPTAWTLPRMALLVPPVLGLALALWLTLRPRRAQPGGQAGEEAPRLGLPLLYALSVSVIFCVGTSAWPVLKGCGLDLAGRYAVPLALVEPLLMLGLFSAPQAWGALRPAANRGQGLWAAALALILIGGALQVGTYLLASPQRTFQSPYYPSGMRDASQLLAYLSAHHIHAAWCDHWIGNVVTYETGGQTTCADYYDQVYHHGLQRPPGSIARVQAEATPSFILNVVERKPVLARELDAQGVPYTLAVLSQSGVTVITPERPVDPATLIAGLSEDYYGPPHR